MSAYYFNFNECQDLSLTEIATQKCEPFFFLWSYCSESVHFSLYYQWKRLLLLWKFSGNLG